MLVNYDRKSIARVDRKLSILDIIFPFLDKNTLICFWETKYIPE